MLSMSSRERERIYDYWGVEGVRGNYNRLEQVVY
jgi:hypothetical protein